MLAQAASAPPAPSAQGRTELELELEKLRPPTYSLLTVQPLYQDKDKLNTVFVQGSQSRYSLFRDYRDTTNLGVGYRRLFLDNSLLSGLNALFDQEWTNGHRRMSVGGELKWAMLDFYANRHFALTGDKAVHPGITEKALGGYDIEMRAQVPYLPWLRVGAKGYAWHARGFEDIRGWSSSLDADIAKNFLLEAGANDDNMQSDPSAFIKLTFRLPSPDRPVLASGARVDSKPFDMRDMKAYALDKVRRQNKIMCQDSPSGGSAGGGPPPGVATGGPCAVHAECGSKLCNAGVCTDCAMDADCPGGQLCILGPPPVCQ